jgi:hypothetical protein
LEMLEKAGRGLDLTKPVNGLVVHGAPYRLINAKRRKEAQNSSLDFYEEERDDRLPKEVAISEDDLDSAMVLAEWKDDPILQQRLVQCLRFSW